MIPDSALLSEGTPEARSHTLLAELKTDLHPCAIEALSAHRFLCGMYELDEGQNMRRGRIIICDATAAYADTIPDELGAAAVSGIPILASVDVDGGVLDCKLAGNLAAAALSTGQINFFRISEEETSEEGPGNVQLRLCGVAASPEEGLFLSVDWACGSSRAHNPLSSSGNRSGSKTAQESGSGSGSGSGASVDGAAFVAVSTQCSSLLVYDTSRLDFACSSSVWRQDTAAAAAALPAFSGVVPTLPVVSFKNAHVMLGESVPAWIVAFDPHSAGTRLVSGGDDCAVRLWDTRTPHNCIASNTKVHAAGVTSAAWHPCDENFCITGSYDGFSRLWDVRNMKQPCWELDTGGGVWRTKWWNTGKGTDGYLALASMHAGSAVYSVSSLPAAVRGEGGGAGAGAALLPVKIGAHYQHSEHPSGHLAYGLALLQGRGAGEAGAGGAFVAASCSFYDDSIQVWAVGGM